MKYLSFQIGDMMKIDDVVIGIVLLSFAFFMVAFGVAVLKTVGVF